MVPVGVATSVPCADRRGGRHATFEPAAVIARLASRALALYEHVMVSSICDAASVVIVTVLALFVGCVPPRPYVAPSAPASSPAPVASASAPPAPPAIPAVGRTLSPEEWRARGMLGNHVGMVAAPGLAVASLDAFVALNRNPRAGTPEADWRESAREQIIVGGREMWLLTLELPGDMAALVVLRREAASYVVVTAVGVSQGGLGATIQTVDRWLDASGDTALIVLRIERWSRGFHPDQNKTTYIEPQCDMSWMVLGLHADKGLAPMPETRGYAEIHVRHAAPGGESWFDTRCEHPRGMREKLLYDPVRERFTASGGSSCKTEIVDPSLRDP